MNLKIELLKASMPVGIVVTLGVSTNPNTLYGFGTWTRIQGRVVVGVSDSDTDFDLDDTGGAKTHTLISSEIPSHSHSLSSKMLIGQMSSSGFGAGLAAGPAYSKVGNLADTGAGTSTGSTGSDGAHNNLQPYIAKYVWQRTA